jgi:hypothetical protein
MSEATMTDEDVQRYRERIERLREVEPGDWLALAGALLDALTEARAQLATLRAESAATVEEARRQATEAERAAVVAMGDSWLASAREVPVYMHDAERIGRMNGLARFVGDVKAGRHVAREDG